MAGRVVSFKIDDDLYRMLEEYAKQRKLSKSEVIRMAILAYISEEGSKLRPYIGKRMKIYV